MPTQTDNEQDSKDIADKAYHDTFDSNGNTVADDLASLETDLDRKYSQDFDALDNTDQNESVGDQERTGSYYRSSADSPYQGNDLKSRLLRLKGVKNKGATTGTAASIFLIGGILISLASGSSFWVALEKNLTNDASDDARINAVMHRAFNNLFNVKGCTPGTLICKMRTMTKEQVQKWKDGRAIIKGSVVDAKGNEIRGSPGETVDPDSLKDGEGVKASSVEFSDGVEATSGAEANEHIDNSVSQRSLLSRGFNALTGDFIHQKFGKMLTEKFGINKTKATTEEKKTNNAKESAQSEADKAAKTASGTLKEKFLKAATSSTAQILQAGVDYACMGYNTAHIAVGAVKAKWTIDLIRFAWPFMRLIAKIQDGSATDEDFQQIEDKFTQLVDYISPTRADELKDSINNSTLSDVDKRELKEFGINPDDDKDVQIQQIEEITNKNAFDSQSIQDMIYGNTDRLSAFTKKFSTGIIGSGTLLASFILNKVEQFGTLGITDDVKSGRQNIKSFCKANKALGAIMAAGGVSEAGFDLIQCMIAATNPASAIKCLGRIVVAAAKMESYILIMDKVGTLIASAIVTQVMKEAPDLPSDTLRGPAAGDALASGLALLLMHKAMSSGAKPAMSVIAVNQFISSTQQHYDAYGDQVAYYNARETPFDASNRYSFLGQITNVFKPQSNAQNQQAGLLSYISNMVAIVPRAFNSTASALHSQPSLMTLNEANLNARTGGGSCPSDEEKEQTGIVCDRGSGRAVQIVSPRVLKWAEEDASGKADHLKKAIDWMQTKQEKPEEHGTNSGTKDKTCTGFMEKLYSLLSLEWGDIGKCSDSGTKESIDSDGNPVPGSQYEKFVKYCRNRQLDYGSTDIDQSTGSAKEQAWHDGTQCGLTYDCHGTASTTTDDKKLFDKNCDTGEGSLMMDYFTYYYNMCYVQYAVSNNRSDCTSDKPISPSAPSTQTTQTTPSNPDGTVALDPGHSVQDIHDIDPATGGQLYDYPNGREVYDAWDVATRVKTKLEQDGYTVKMLKNSVDERVNFQERANRAKGSALVVSIHTNAGGGTTNQVAPQFVGGYREANLGKTEFSNANTATKSQECATAMAKSRAEKEGHAVSTDHLPAFTKKDRGDDFAEGTLPWVQLLSQDTLWVYNEFDPPDGGGGSNGISETSKNKYVEGLVAGIKACNPPKSSAKATSL